MRTTTQASILAMALCLFSADPVRSTTPAPSGAPSDPHPYPCIDIPIEQADEIDFHAYFDTEAQANAVAARIDEARFEVTVRTAADGPDWVLRALYRELPDPKTHAIQGPPLAALAKSEGGRMVGFTCSSRPHRR